MASLAFFEEMDQALLYTALILAVIASSMHRTGRATFQRLNYSKELWKLMRAITSRELIIQGLKWGIPRNLLYQLVTFHKHVARRLRLKSYYSKKKSKGTSTKTNLKKRKRLNKTVTLYRKMPLKAISRLWGKVNQMDLPVFLRKPLIGLYIWMFGCKIDEAEIQDLQHYKNLGEFFRRQLKPNVRPIDLDHQVTSPADGKVLHYGEVTSGYLEQVKGVTYSLKGFLGTTPEKAGVDDDNFQRNLLKNPENALYHCVIYLAPGDYHRFHSPTDWLIKHRRHFPGELLSVNPGVARWIEGLFNFNERVVYTGEWEHGFFSMTAVGATNVGSIKIYCDEALSTNMVKKHPAGSFLDEEFKIAVPIMKGQMLGEFNLGSTIVLVFEAPLNFDFKITNNQKVKYGEPMGTVSSTDSLNP
ncbi:hypothetical protein SNE40_004137 [Patella caerulea]|uniref:Phosphatidylserine decarboxylase proenzyme, mitochondrial n=1 Tax=Patella caerulea TaxID=87958 RepID=A0AAN8QGB7_PATCE